MMTEIQTIDGGQKDALSRRANIKKWLTFSKNASFILFSIFFDPTCPTWCSRGSVPCAANLLSKFPCIYEGDPKEAPLQTHFPSPLLPQVHEGVTGRLEHTNNLFRVQLLITIDQRRLRRGTWRARPNSCPCCSTFLQ